MNQLLAVSPSAASSPYPDVSTFRERTTEKADHLGLPPVGARLSSSDGMQWLVIDHMHAPNLVSYARDRGLSSPLNPADLLPRVAAEHLSKRLLDFWIETDRCTSKAFLIVDTLPHLRPQYAFRHGHSVDAWSVPDATLFAFDFANIHESIIAHEIAHVWIDLVEDCEDYRSPVDWLDTARAQQILFIQSFVLDCKVNQVVRERGFDLSIFAEHSRQAISNFTQAVLLGHRPATQCEATLNALMIAATLLEQEGGLHAKETHAPVLCYDGSVASALRLLRAELPEIYDLAERFVAAVQNCGTDNREQIRLAIDECLTVAFEFSGDPLDLENALCEEAPNETYQLDKTPDFLPGWPVRAKIEANKIRAKLRVGNDAPYRLSQSFSGAMQIEFLHPCGMWTSPVIMPHAPCVPQLPASQSALPPGLRHLSPAVLNLLPETVRTQQPPKTGRHAMQIPQLPVVPALPDMPASWLGASSKPPYGRSYMAGVGLWLSEARLQEQLDLREHPYGYANNNPLNFVDPTGLFIPPYTPPVVGGGVAGAGEVVVGGGAAAAGWFFAGVAVIAGVSYLVYRKADSCTLHYYQNQNTGLPAPTFSPRPIHKPMPGIGPGKINPGRDPKTGKCRPCPRGVVQIHIVPPGSPDSMKHGDCPSDHWHCLKFNQSPNCDCYRQRVFGGCIPPPAPSTC